MIDFITGWILGRNSKNLCKKEVIQEPVDNRPIEEIIEIPKVYKYVPIPDIYDFEATLETSYDDYEKTNLVVIHKNGHLIYYLEVLVPQTQIYWREEKMYDFI